MKGLSEVLALAEKKELGPSPAFTKEHALLAFMAIGSSRAAGRKSLAASSGMGEGSVRTVLGKFRQAGLIQVDSAGIKLSREGMRTYRSIMKKLSPTIILPISPLTLGKFQTGVLARTPRGLPSTGIEQRDAAVRIGADSATSYLFKGERFAVPGGSSDCEKDYPSGTWGVLREELEPADGDVVIVSGGRSQIVATLGALSAALTLL